MIYSITIVTGQGVKRYAINDKCEWNGGTISKIIYSPVVLNENIQQNDIYQVLDVDGKILVEIINCPVEIVYL